MEGSIKLARCILESQVFAHQLALKIWIWCLCKATFKERFVPLKIGRGEITVKLLPGQFIFGRFKAEEELGIDGSTIYKWMQKFSSSEYEMIKIESNNQYSIVTICKWEEYQINEKKKVTTKEQPSNNQVTAEEQPSNTNNNVFNDKNEKNVIPPTFEMVSAYCKERKNNVDPQRFLDNNEAKGWVIGKTKMKDWQAAIRTWEKNDFTKSDKPEILKIRTGEYSR